MAFNAEHVFDENKAPEQESRAVEPPSLSQQPRNCFLVYDFEGESTIKQVGWEVWGFYLSPESTHQK